MRPTESLHPDWKFDSTARINGHKTLLDGHCEYASQYPKLLVNSRRFIIPSSEIPSRKPNLSLALLVSPKPPSKKDAVICGYQYNATDPYVPKQEKAWVKFTFNRDVDLGGVEVLEHVNGITKIGWSVDESALTEVELENKQGANAFQQDPESRTFLFDQKRTHRGRTLRIVMLKANERLECNSDNAKQTYAGGWCIYRIYPLNPQGARIQPQIAP